MPSRESAKPLKRSRRKGGLREKETASAIARDVLSQIEQPDGRQSRHFVIGKGPRAVIGWPSKGNLISAVHCFIEGVHFDLTFTTPSELGHKLLAIALSELAASGAQPQYALMTLGVTQKLSDVFVAEFFHGTRSLASRFGVEVEGGNTSLSPQALIVHVLLMGKAHPADTLPFAAEPGDLIAVTGTLGAAAGGMNCLRQLGRPSMEPRRKIFESYVSPQPRVAESLALVKAGLPTALVDNTEGLATDLNYLVMRSDVGAYIDETMLPVSDETLDASRLITANPRLWALYGAEDYELLFTVRPENIIKVEKVLKPTGLSYSVIGEIKPKKHGVMLRTLSGELNPFQVRGWHPLVRRRK
jgi:thiamine-monophosphate kinase